MSSPVAYGSRWEDVRLAMEPMPSVQDFTRLCQEYKSEADSLGFRDIFDRDIYIESRLKGYSKEMASARAKTRGWPHR